MSMKENHAETNCNLKNSCGEEDSISFGCREVYKLNVSRGGIGPMEVKLNAVDEHWDTKISDNSSDGNVNGNGTIKLNGRAHHLVDGHENNHQLRSGVIDEEKLRGQVEDGLADQFMLCKIGEPRKSGSVHITISDLFEADDDLYTDKNVLECEPPDLSSKEANCHIMKDICVDEGMPAEDKNSSKNSSGGESRFSLFRHPNYFNREGVEGGNDDEIIIASDEIHDILCGNKELCDDEKPGQCQKKSASEISPDDDTAENCIPEDSRQSDETSREAAGSIVASASEEESFVERILPVQEFGTRSFLRSFLNSMGSEENRSLQPLDNGLSGIGVSDSMPVSMEARSKEDNKPNCTIYNSKVEVSSITFDFSNPAPGASSATTERTNYPKEQSNESRNVHDDADVKAGNTADVSFLQFISIKDNFTADCHNKAHDIKNDNLQNSSAAKGLTLSSKGMRNKIDPVESVDDNSDARSNNNEVQNVSTSNERCSNDDGLAVDAHAMKHKRINSDDVSVVTPLPHDDGDANFSAAGLISFSGPVAYSGSLSLRSEGSATSGRSFAFPVLQSEWNNSPVRMANEDRRHFRKHKGWRSGLLCCRF